MSKPLTAGQIPCCLCGTLILPNAANQCGSCLAQSINLQQTLQQGPGGADYVTIQQCRQCRRYARTPTHFEPLEWESPGLLAVCLKHIPALQNTHDKIRLMDAGWIWTEPHSMRIQLHLTVRKDIFAVAVQQRVKVEQRVHWSQCPDCNREYTNRTWQAVVQLRQNRPTLAAEGPRKGLATLEMALRRRKDIRKHVLRMDSVKNGFDFYFLSIPHAQLFSSYLQRMAPMRTKQSRKLVSTDVKNNTANVKHTITCEVVPVSREDLYIVDKSANSRLAGRLAVVSKITNVLHWQDASPSPAVVSVEQCQADLTADAYYRNEKSYRLYATSYRMTRFVVLDVELATDNHDHHHNHNDDNPLFQGPSSGVSKYALADVVVARESDFGVNDTVYTCRTVLGHLIQAGDVVLGYDLASSTRDVQGLQANYTVPDVVLVKKVNERNPSGQEDDNNHDAAAEKEGKPKLTKKKERRLRRQEGKKSRQLEESAVRMGFLEGDEEEEVDFDAELAADPAMAEELALLEQNLNELDVAERNKDEAIGEDKEGETEVANTEEEGATEDLEPSVDSVNETQSEDSLF